MTLIPLLFITLDTIVQYGPYVGAGITFILGAYKDTIMNKLNLKKSKSEVDSIHIQNSRELMEMHTKSFNELQAAKDKHIEEMKANHQEEMDEIREEHQKNLLELKIATEKHYTAKIEQIESEFQATVADFKKQVDELKKFIKELTEERDFYKAHSKVEFKKKK